jgi:hypothetical protein
VRSGGRGREKSCTNKHQHVLFCIIQVRNWTQIPAMSGNHWPNLTSSITCIAPISGNRDGIHSIMCI